MMPRLLGSSLMALACVTALASETSVDLASQIAYATSAAPASVSAEAAVGTMSDSGEYTELRKGTNGWTCLEHDPATPKGYPLCLDRNGLEWMMAAMAGREPDPGKVGYSYMLKGGTSWSATDVTATKLAPGLKDYIRIPPHVMIMNARIAEASGFPSGEMAPDTRRPFVIYGGTPYAILIIPLE